MTRELTIGIVDAFRDAGAREREHVQGGEVRPQETIFLEGLRPRQNGQKLFGVLHQRLEPDGLKRKNYF